MCWRRSVVQPAARARAKGSRSESPEKARPKSGTQSATEKIGRRRVGSFAIPRQLNIAPAGPSQQNETEHAVDIQQNRCSTIKAKMPTTISPRTARCVRKYDAEWKGTRQTATSKRTATHFDSCVGCEPTVPEVSETHRRRAVRPPEFNQRQARPLPERKRVKSCSRACCRAGCTQSTAETGMERTSH